MSLLNLAIGVWLFTSLFVCFCLVAVGILMMREQF